MKAFQVCWQGWSSWTCHSRLFGGQAQYRYADTQLCFCRTAAEKRLQAVLAEMKNYYSQKESVDYERATQIVEVNVS